MNAAQGVTVSEHQLLVPPRAAQNTATPAPRPLPDAWARSVANSIAEALRKGWRRHVIMRAISCTGDPKGNLYHPSGSIPGPAPASEKVGEVIYQRGLADPVEKLAVPWLVWELTQLDLAAQLIARNLMKHHLEVDEWLRKRPASGPAPAPFVLRSNRHGKLTLRRNSEYTPEGVALVFEAAAHAATVWVPDPLDVADALAENVSVDVAALDRLDVG